MTAVYARLHDTTLRKAFETYCRTRVNVDGERLAFDDDTPTADAEWVKQHFARVEAGLPNGYCGRPPQQHCPHPNACLPYADFQTTVEFLPVHRRQAEETRKLPDAAPLRPRGVSAWPTTTAACSTTSSASSRPSSPSQRRMTMTTSERSKAMVAAAHRRHEEDASQGDRCAATTRR